MPTEPHSTPDDYVHFEDCGCDKCVQARKLLDEYYNAKGETPQARRTK